MEIERKKGGRPSKKPPKEVLAMLYQRMTAPEIAKHYGVSESAVRTWLHDYRQEDKKEVI